MNKARLKQKTTFPLINMELLRKNKHFFFLFMGLFMALIIGFIDYFTSDKFKDSFLGGILVEAHGMLLDIILFGVLLTIYEKITEKHNEIERLKEEIDDYRGWNEPEATYRIVGCINRLNKRGITNINLKECFLDGANLKGMNLKGASLIGVDFKGVDLSYANLESTYLDVANLEGAKLIGANLRCARLVMTNLQGANLNNADLREANLSFAKLQGASLDTANLNNSLLYSADFKGAYLWGTRLEGAKILDLEELKIINDAAFEKYEAKLIKGDYVKKTDYYEVFVMGNYTNFL